MRYFVTLEASHPQVALWTRTGAKAGAYGGLTFQRHGTQFTSDAVRVVPDAFIGMPHAFVTALADPAPQPKVPPAPKAPPKKDAPAKGETAPTK